MFYLKIALSVSYGTAEFNRLVLASFCLLTCVMLLNFLRHSEDRKAATAENKRGLLFLAFAFLSYAILGVVAIWRPEHWSTVLLSGGFNICLLMSLPFFSRGVSKMDMITTDKSWKIVTVFVASLYLGTVCYSVATGNTENSLGWAFMADRLVSAVALLTFGVFVGRDLVRRNLYFPALVSGAAFLTVVILQSFPVAFFGDGKFVHVNSTMLAPAMFLAIIAISMGFNWINELNFRRVAQMYSPEQTDETVQRYLDGLLEKSALKEKWQDDIARDNIEVILEQMIEIFKKRNESLELILNLASRNTRNNTAKLKAIVAADDYNLERNRITSVMIEIIKDY